MSESPKPNLQVVRPKRRVDSSPDQLRQLALDEEKMVLRAMLPDPFGVAGLPDVVPLVREILGDGSDFSVGQNREIYRAVIRVFEATPDRFDVTQIASHLIGVVEFPQVILSDMQFAEDAYRPPPENALHYARQIAGRAQERRAREAAVEVAKSLTPIEDLHKVATSIGEPRRRRFPDTELGTAERFVEDHGDDLRFSYLQSQWFVWTGRRWTLDHMGEVPKRAASTARSLLREALGEPDNDRRIALLRLARQTEKKRTLDAIEDLAKPKLPLPPDSFDQDPMVFNCANGTIDLRTGELRPHRREDLLSQISSLEYDTDATCPLWIAFLEQITGGDWDLMRFLQRAAGWSLTGDTTDQKFFVCYGIGSNGKSTFLIALRWVAGTYGQQAAFETFLERSRQDGRPRDDHAHLAGARLVTAVEAPPGRRLDVNAIKQLTGGEAIRARHLYGREFEFVPKLHLWLAANHKPQVTDSTHATWRRLLLIPFTVTIPDDKVDKKLPAKLAKELPGILAWCVDGALKWQDEGLSPPAAVTGATKGYQEEEDDIGGFLEARTVPAFRERVDLKVLRDAYGEWCEAEKEEPLGTKQFSSALQEKGLRIVRTNGRRYVYGVAWQDTYVGDLGLRNEASVESAESDAPDIILP